MKWEGYSVTESTWEPIEHLKGCKKALEAYERKKLNKIKKTTKRILKAKTKALARE